MESLKNSLSVVVPVFNDDEVIRPLYERLIPVLNALQTSYEIVFVDDGSEDTSWSIVEDLKLVDTHVRGIKLSRNFGQQNAITAGLDHTQNEMIVLMDSDLQDKPEDIPLLIKGLIKSGAPMAIARWSSRDDSFSKKLLSKMFYNISQKVTNINHQSNLGVFRVMRRSVVEELKKYQEKTSSTLSILHWIGSDYVAIDLKRDKRFAGKSGYTIHRMMKIALDRIFSFSMLPIRLATIFGLCISLVSFFSGIGLIIRRIYGIVAPGWTSVTVLILFMSGINFLFLGVLGEYVGRIFLETKQRPKYIIKKII